jgi:crotonobetainyl-CoA:carnitine CoA-transferase CaiB-like acyl-CoA transferase
MRLLADLGAICSWWQWQDPSPGEWPTSDPFRGYFEDGVDVLQRERSLQQVREAVRACARSFDLVISDTATTELPEGDLLQALRTSNPAVVVANAEHFGRRGPYGSWAGDELTDYAMGGYWSLGGEMARAPLRVPGRQAQFHCGMHLAFGALAAVRHARLTGCGQEVEVSAIEAMLSAHLSTTLAWTHEGRVLERAGSDLFRAKDGWVFFAQIFLYPNLFVLMDRLDLEDDPRWATTEDFFAHRAEFWEIVAEWCQEKTIAEIVPFGQELRIPVTAVETAETLLADEQLAVRGYFRNVRGASLPGKAFSVPEDHVSGRTSDGRSGGLAELLEHPPEVPSDSDVPQPNGRGDQPALAGLKVLEVTNNWAGPIAARHFADLGADVIKVELPSKPASRSSHYPGVDPGKYHWNRSGYFNQMNRNKRDIALNLAMPQGREVFRELVKWCDVLIENNSARVMPNLGLGYEALAEVNPRLVMVSVTGFGATGPRRDWVAYGSNIEAACGLAAMTGYDDEQPFRTGSYVADPVGGGHAALAMLAGLERRDRTGKGVHIDISLTETLLPFMLESFTHFAEHNVLRPRQGNADPDFAPTGAYRCDGRDDWVAIAVRTDAQWAALCAEAGLAFDTALSCGDRVRCRAEIDAAVTAWTESKSQFEAVRMLQRHGIPAAPILHNWQLHSDPHLAARQSFIGIDHPDTGVLPYPAFPWSFSLTKPAVRMAAPRFAEGNAYVFREVLGMSEGAVKQLYDERVTADQPEKMMIIFA